MTHANEMRAIALKVKKEKDARDAEIVTKYINDIIMPAIKRCALDGGFVLNLELDVTGITYLDAIKLELNKYSYQTPKVCNQYLTIEW